MPVETWVAGDSLLFALALGKERFVSHWCTYCATLSELCKDEESIEGQPWT